MIAPSAGGDLKDRVLPARGELEYQSRHHHDCTAATHERHHMIGAATSSAQRLIGCVGTEPVGLRAPQRQNPLDRPQLRQPLRAAPQDFLKLGTFYASK